MLLIIFLGLIAKLTSVSGTCDDGIQGMNNFDFTKATGTWYVLEHSGNTFEDNFKCVKVTYAAPEGDISLITIVAYDIRAQNYSTLYGNATNWDNTGVNETFPGPIIWNGRYSVIDTDYKSYAILKLCSSVSNQAYYYVAYRRKHPEGKTRHHVEEVLQELKLQLVDWPICKGKQAKSSKEE